MRKLNFYCFEQVLLENKAKTVYVYMGWGEGKDISLSV